MSLTVLVPVYDAAAFVAETVASALAQTHRDIRLAIAVEPGGEGAPHEPEASLAALAPFAADARVAITVNAERLGWTRNINRMLEAVETPFFAILPHDDLWHPRYVETLRALLLAQPAASAAYCDIRSFGPRRSWRSGLPIRAGTDTLGQMFDFFLEGPRGMPWRGVTRTQSLAATKGFPAGDDLGILAETEYALRLLAAGPVIHHPDVLFVKRVQAGKRTSASQDRAVAALGARREGLARHFETMERLVATAAEAAAPDEADRAILDLLVLSRRLSRVQTVLKEPLGATDVAALEAGAARLAAIEGAPRFGGAAGRVAAGIHGVLAAEARARREPAREQAAAEAAIAAAPDDPGACLCYARILVRQGRTLEAVEVLDRAREHSAAPRQIEGLLAGLVPAISA